MNDDDRDSSKTGLEIAVIGMAGRFPGAGDINEFWDNLKNGVESICFFSDRELEESGIDPGLIRDANYVKAKGMLGEIEYYDYAFFDYTRREAEWMDPQFRILHECCWHALEDAAYDPDTYTGAIGLYVGTLANYQWVAGLLNRLGNPSEQTVIGSLNDRDFFSTWVAYRLNLRGPAITVQTACSTSLTAIHMACQSLLSGESDMVVAGGVSVWLPKKNGYLYEPGMIRSADGRCRTFDAAAGGTNGGDGAALVVLKRLEDALNDGDRIDAVVKGSAMNNDGRRKVGYTAPSVEGQAEVIRAALQMAEVEPESITMIEAHGTATALGDPVEIEALKKAFDTDKCQFCAIGSVKTNVGHLDAASGAAGFIKAVLALKHRLIPPNLHFNTPNPAIDFENNPFFVNTCPLEWKHNHYPLRAGVSSFGLGGTNVHVILEEAPSSRGQKTDNRGQSQGRGGVSPPGQSREYQLILLSAKTQSALDRMTVKIR
jgi:acyl transferase domain-containing protein